MFKKILCPTDFSPGSTQAMAVAVRLARDASAGLTLANVWHVPGLAYGAEPLFAGTALDGMIADETRALAAAVAEATQLGAPRVTSVFLDGPPWECLCDTLRHDPGFDLVVMATHGRTGVRRILLGSVTEQVVRHAPCAVLTVRGAGAPFRHILCAIDFSESARHAMDRARDLAAPGGLGIELLHVIEPRTLESADFIHPAQDVALERAASRLLDEWAAELRAAVAVPVIAHVRVGSPAETILTTLDADPTFDLAIVGSHGRTGLRRLVLGSVAEQTVRHASCAVLVARTRAPAAAG